MQSSLRRITKISKLSKLFVLAIVLVAVVATMMPASAVVAPAQTNAGLLVRALDTAGKPIKIHVGVHISTYNTVGISQEGDTKSTDNGYIALPSSGFYSQRTWSLSINTNMPLGYVVTSTTSNKNGNANEILPENNIGLTSLSNIRADNLPINAFVFCTFNVKKVTLPGSASVTLTTSPSANLYPGDAAMVNVSIKNTGTTPLNSMRFEIETINADWNFNNTTLLPGQTVSGQARWYIPTTATSNILLNSWVTVLYEDQDLKIKNAQFNIPLTIPTTPLVDSYKVVTKYDRLPQRAGDTMTLTHTITNTGNTTLYDININTPAVGKTKRLGLYAGLTTTVKMIYVWDGTTKIVGNNLFTTNVISSTLNPFTNTLRNEYLVVNSPLT